MLRSSFRLIVPAAALLVVMAAAYGLLSAQPDAEPSEGYRDVTVADLAEAVAAGAFVLDVREPWEYEGGHVRGATLIPLAALEARARELPDDTPLYVVCRSGNRSVTASRILVNQGRRDVRNVEGGMLAWQAQGYPVAR